RVGKEAVEIIHSSFRPFAMRWCRLSCRCFPPAIMVNDRLAAMSVIQSRQASSRYPALWSHPIRRLSPLAQPQCMALQLKNYKEKTAPRQIT
ncbi:MAG: hypothetical protein KA197_08855, partial [Aquabacterium sp.]|nr:hypothetical protein [Aquabacterium sp.]